MRNFLIFLVQTEHDLIPRITQDKTKGLKVEEIRKPYRIRLQKYVQIAYLLGIVNRS